MQVVIFNFNFFKLFLILNSKFAAINNILLNWDFYNKKLN